LGSRGGAAPLPTGHPGRPVGHGDRAGQRATSAVGWGRARGGGRREVAAGAEWRTARGAGRRQVAGGGRWRAAAGGGRRVAGGERRRWRATEWRATGWS
ncbi:hypothetical protein ACFWGZ_34660, partial [Lentzea sp. NPDC060358]